MAGKHIKDDDRQRWERYELRKPSDHDEENDSSTDEDAEVQPDPLVVRARTPPEGEAIGEPLVQGETPADEHGYPMVRGLTTRLPIVDLVEAYSPPRVPKEAMKYGLRPGDSWDLTEGWDFRLAAHREAALKYQNDKQP